jgi:hypothetical protein
MNIKDGIEVDDIVEQYNGPQAEYLKGKSLVAGMVVDRVNRKVGIVIDADLPVAALVEVRVAFNKAMEKAIGMASARERMTV